LRRQAELSFYSQVFRIRPPGTSHLTLDTGSEQ